MPDGQGLQIYGAYKQRQQAMRNKLLDLMGQQVQMRTQEQFYRTRPGEVAREEYYKAGAEERRAGIGKETLPEIHYGLLTEEQQRKVAPIHFGLEPKAGEESLEEVYYGLLNQKQRERAARIKFGLEAKAELPEKPTELEKLQDIRQTIEEKEKIKDLTNEQRSLLKSTREVIKDLDDYIETRYIKIEEKIDEDDPIIKRYVKIIKDNEIKLLKMDFPPRSPEEEQKWRMQYNLTHPEAPLPLVSPGGLLKTPIKEGTEKSWRDYLK